MFIKHTDETFIDLKNLCEILLITGVDTAIKWCKKANIKIQIIGKKRVVYRFLVEMEIDKKLVSELKSKYPDKWEELYQCYKDNDRVGYLLLIEDNTELDFRPISKQAIPQSRFSKRLANS